MAKLSKTAWFNAAKSWDFEEIRSMSIEAPEFLTWPALLNRGSTPRYDLLERCC